jgi:hypothetical protein
LLFAYVALGSISVALGDGNELNTGMMVLLIGLILSIVVIYIFWMAKIAKRGAAKLKDQGSKRV